VATYSEDGKWMWNEESSTWIPSPPSPNNATESVTSTVNTNENYCDNCGKIVYKGWEKCTSCGVIVEPLMKNRSDAKPFEYEFGNPFQKGNEEILSSSLKEKIKSRKKIILNISTTIFSLSLAILTILASSGEFTPKCTTERVPSIGSTPQDITFENVQTCTEPDNIDPIFMILSFSAIFSIMVFIGILPVSLKHWRYSLPERKDFFNKWVILLFIIIIVLLYHNFL